MLLMDFDFSSSSCIDWMTFLVMFAVVSDVCVSVCTEDIPVVMVSPVAEVSFPNSSALELTLLIFPDKESIWLIQLSEPVSSLFTPLSISSTALWIFLEVSRNVPDASATWIAASPTCWLTSLTSRISDFICSTVSLTPSHSKPNSSLCFAERWTVRFPLETLRNWRRIYLMVPVIWLERNNPSASAMIIQTITSTVVSCLIPDDCSSRRSEGISAVTIRSPAESLLYTNMYDLPLNVIIWFPESFFPFNAFL